MHFSTGTRFPIAEETLDVDVQCNLSGCADAPYKVPHVMFSTYDLDFLPSASAKLLPIRVSDTLLNLRQS